MKFTSVIVQFNALISLSLNNEQCLWRRCPYLYLVDISMHNCSIYFHIQFCKVADFGSQPPVKVVRIAIFVIIVSTNEGGLLSMKTRYKLLKF